VIKDKNHCNLLYNHCNHMVFQDNLTLTLLTDTKCHSEQSEESH